LVLIQPGSNKLIFLPPYFIPFSTHAIAIPISIPIEHTNHPRAYQHKLSPLILFGIPLLHY
jgi:hypothetical protein